MSPAVHQLLPVLSLGDAIGGAVRTTRDLLVRMGFRSHIYADLIDPRLTSLARPAHELGDLEPGDVLLYHMSIGSPTAQLWERTKAKRVLVYHNITPPEFYADVSPRVAYYLQQGRAELEVLAPLSELCIADSSFNLAEVTALGARHGVVIAPPVDLQRLAPAPSAPTKPPTLLAVGRLAPNKRQDDLIRVLAAAHALGLSDLRLVLAGTSDDTESYAAVLRRTAAALGIAGAVEIPARRLSDDDLHRLYMDAAIYLSASEHEGFCIPLLEAMAFEVPVIAYSAGAVPETMGQAGILISSKDPLVWAEAVRTLLDDLPLREQLVTAGRERLLDFSHDKLADQLREALASIGINTVTT